MTLTELMKQVKPNTSRKMYRTSIGAEDWHIRVSAEDYYGAIIDPYIEFASQPHDLINLSDLEADDWEFKES